MYIYRSFLYIRKKVTNVTDLIIRIHYHINNLIKEILMFNKIGKIIRKLHRYLTPFFVVLTVWFTFINKNPELGVVLGKVQKVAMLALAATGSYLYVQIYYNKYKSKKRKKANSTIS